MKHPVAEIFSQGEEVITGQVADTNAAWLSRELNQMGFVISRHTAVGDKLADLMELLKEISQRADVCICTGGLGPTVDDLTAEAFANAFDAPLQLDVEALKQIEDSFLVRNRIMADSNRKQALFPKRAIRIDNAWGTAPGFAILQNRCWFVFLPGVPSEMKPMFKAWVKQSLEQKFSLKADKLISIKSIGIGESDLQQKLNDFSLPPSVKLGFWATTNEVHTKLLFPAETRTAEINDCIDQLVSSIGDKVYAIDYANGASTDLIAVINLLMDKQGHTLSIMETTTQGHLAAKCIEYDWLQESIYKNKAYLLNDETETYEKQSLLIAEQFKQQSKASLILIQLYQGDKYKDQHKESCILLYNILLTPDGVFQNTTSVNGAIKRKQNQAATRALDLLRRYLQR